MARTYKTYDDDYKKNIVKLFENGKAVSDIEREYGINRKLIYNWKNKYGTIKTSTGEVTTNDEILKLKKELNDIKIENEIPTKEEPVVDILDFEDFDAPELPKDEEEKREPQLFTEDIQKELEAKFDELFGPME